ALVVVRRSAGLRAAYASVASFAMMAAMITSLLPVFAKHAIGTDARGYGMMIGAVGTGAILSALAFRSLRAKVSSRALGAIAMAAFGCLQLIASQASSVVVAALLLFPAGATWVATFATLNALVQLQSPPDAKSRILSLYQFTFYGPWCFGAVIAGSIAN